eukprot:scaffold41588_cov197-Skeletonema_marinoi.AAC.1
MFKLGLGSDSDSNPVSDLGNRVRRALRIVYNDGAGAAQAIPPVGPFHGTPQTPMQATAYYNQYHQYNHETPVAGGGGLSYANPNPNFFALSRPTPPNGAVAASNVYHHLPPGTPGGGYSNVVPNGGHYYDYGFAGSVGSHAGTSFSHDPYGGQQQQMNHSQGAHYLARRGKENFVNAPPAPSVPSHIPSMRGGDAASTGMSTLSLNESSNGAKKIEKVIDPHATMQLPEVHNKTMMDGHRMTQFVDRARNNPHLATQANSELQTDSRKHVGLNLANNALKEQMGIYDAEETRCRAGIDGADRKSKNVTTAHEKRMADKADEETEELRAAVAKIKAKFADEKANEEKDFARKKRESDDEGNEWKEKLEKNKSEKEENLTLAKAKLLSFEIGTEIFASLSQLESNQENTEFLRRIDYNISRLNQYRDILSRISDNEPGAEEAMELLKTLVWDDHTEL